MKLIQGLNLPADGGGIAQTIIGLSGLGPARPSCWLRSRPTGERRMSALELFQLLSGSGILSGGVGFAAWVLRTERRLYGLEVKAKLRKY
jgi:hypothetical protein